MECSESDGGAPNGSVVLIFKDGSIFNGSFPQFRSLIESSQKGCAVYGLPKFGKCSV